jgi:zinc protease
LIRRIPVLLLTLLLSLAAVACQPIRPPEAQPASTGAAAADETLLPADPAVRMGRLDNGLAYYIRHNTEPAQRADLWLVINAGSAQEEEGGPARAGSLCRAYAL